MLLFFFLVLFLLRLDFDDTLTTRRPDTPTATATATRVVLFRSHLHRQPRSRLDSSATTTSNTNNTITRRHLRLYDYIDHRPRHLFSPPTRLSRIYSTSQALPACCAAASMSLTPLSQSTTVSLHDSHNGRGQSFVIALCQPCHTPMSKRRQSYDKQYKHRMRPGNTNPPWDDDDWVG